VPRTTRAQSKTGFACRDRIVRHDYRHMRALASSCVLVCLLAACGGSSDASDSGVDGGRTDGGGDAGKLIDAGGEEIDAGLDAAAVQLDAAQASDAGSECAAMDAMEGRECGPAEEPAVRYHYDGRDCVLVAWCGCIGADCDQLFGSEEDCEAAFDACIGATCRGDGDCIEGEEWCLDGHCRPCDNSGRFCRIACPEGWSVYTRHGCNPCECAPPNECANDRECPDGRVCYPGAFCWCSPAEPGCCMGNVCSMPGCEELPPMVGCRVRGCPVGQECDREMCASSGCDCNGSAWSCLRDCAGGRCVGG
jgi:hypothetical protein